MVGEGVSTPSLRPACAAISTSVAFDNKSLRVRLHARCERFAHVGIDRQHILKFRQRADVRGIGGDVCAQPVD